MNFIHRLTREISQIYKKFISFFQALKHSTHGGV